MSTIRGLYNRIQKVDTDQIIAESLEDSASGFVGKQQDQMYEGINSDGSEREPAYSPVTIALKRIKGQRTDVVTLHDTGDFYRGQYIDVRNDIIIEDSADVKTAKLVKKYGEKMFGLSKPFKIMYLDEDLRPVFKNKIESATGLVMKSA
ncbi:MAG TPA: hypothetical protein VMZ03_03870 [Chitinophagaceae bacterium]|nr:hypothetical protein [Chitinophagaceae bacterium]